jgi:hypothetical protein
LFYFTNIKKEEKKELPKGEEIKKEKAIQEILESLTPKESTPLSEKEKKKIEEALESLTPKKQKMKTQEEIKKEEELLKSITPQ